MGKPVLLLPAVFASAMFSSGGGIEAKVAYTGECVGGGLALTPELYVQGYAAYKDAACVPDGAFCHSAGVCPGSPGLSFTGDVNLTNMKQLVYVGESAFNFFAGKLTADGPFPLWTEIASSAFSGGGTAESVVALDGALALEKVGTAAFGSFMGTVSAKGTYPNFRGCLFLPGGDVLAPGLALTPDVYMQGTAAYKDAVCIPDNAFCQSANYCPSRPSFNFTGEVILEDMEELVYVGRNAFRYFAGTITIAGTFPKWREIGDSAFAFGGNAASSVSLDDGAPALETVHADAFFGFSGQLTIVGSFPVWTELGAYAFYEAGTAASEINIRCRGDPWSVGTLAFGLFKGEHKSAEKGEERPCNGSGSSWGQSASTVFVTLFLGISAGYWGLGYVYMAVATDATGSGRVLHYTALAGVFGLAKTGIACSSNWLASCGNTGTHESYDAI